MPEVRWIDDHCHLHHRSGTHVGHSAGDAEVVAGAVSEALDAGVTEMITVGTDVADSIRGIEVAAAHPGIVFATAGVHPHDAAGGTEGLEELLSAPEVVAVGECGLDHHYDHSPRDDQRRVFAEQIALANRHDLALVIHTREAWDETFDILGAEGVPERTIFHCFTGGPDEARRCLDVGAMLSFSGIITFKTADDIRAAAAITPLDRALVETDSPFLTPVPHRGKPNSPALLPLVGEGLAAAMGRDVAEVAAATTANAIRTYRLPGR